MLGRGSWKITVTLIVYMVIVVSSCLTTDASLQPLKLEPSRCVFEGRPGEQMAGSIVVRNTGQDIATPQAVLSDWTLNEANRLVVLEAGSLDSSLAGWIKFNPRRFQIGPYDGQTVRFTVRSPHDANPGERRGMIAFEQVVPYDEEAIGAITRVQVTATIHVAVFPVERSVDVVGLYIQSYEDTSDSTLIVQLRGTGNGHFRGTGYFDIFTSDDETPLFSGDLEPVVVMPDVVTRFLGTIDYDLTPGHYRLAIEIIPEEVGGGPLQKIYTFEVPET
ncbi:MAG: hypothetical protein GX162_13860 [Firmicutes bacterium]|jgi:hypothetical protein|nr:hypothetical protein [Bacillota bacterium]